MRLYLGTPGWGWRMYGIGYKTLWFFGFSIQDSTALAAAQQKGDRNE